MNNNKQTGILISEYELGKSVSNPVAVSVPLLITTESEAVQSPRESVGRILVTAATRDISVRRAAEKHLAQMEEGRRLVEDELRESEERYRMLLDGIQSYAIFVMDPVGQILSWNAGAERIKGYTADQIIGHNFSCFFAPADIER